VLLRAPVRELPRLLLRLRLGLLVGQPLLEQAQRTLVLRALLGENLLGAAPLLQHAIIEERARALLHLGSVLRLAQIGRYLAPVAQARREPRLVPARGGLAQLAQVLGPLGP